MGLENVPNGRISELNSSNPTSGDAVNRGDDHIRNVKQVIKTTFSGIDGEGSSSVPVTATSGELNILDGVTATTDELNILDGITATTAELNVLDGVSSTLTSNELNVLDGVTATTAELNYVDGVTSSIQSQVDGKQDTLTAGSNVSISNNTISASGTPFVVVADERSTTGNGTSVTANQWINLPVNEMVYPDANVSGSPSVPTGVSINTGGNTLTLPEGTYYFEATAKIYNASYSDTNQDVRVQLYRANGSPIGYAATSYLGEHDTYSFPCTGMFTVGAGGDDVRLRAFAESGGTVRYGDSGAQGLQSIIKVWKM